MTPDELRCPHCRDRITFALLEEYAGCCPECGKTVELDDDHE